MIISVTKEKTAKEILVADRVLSSRECKILITLYVRYSKLRALYKDANRRPLVDYYTVQEEEPASAGWIYRVTLRCKERIQAYLKIPELYIESFYLACLRTGDSHIAHADNERQKRGRWVANHTPERDYTGIAYLNDDFTGGELVFPELNFTVRPKPGLFVGFPSNHNFIHAVPRVTSGKRYSLPVWFSVNSKEAMEL